MINFVSLSNMEPTPIESMMNNREEILKSLWQNSRRTNMNAHELVSQSNENNAREPILDQLQTRASRAVEQAGVASSVPAPEFARCLEKLIQKQSISLKEHGKVNSVEDALHSLHATLLRRRERKTNSTPNLSSPPQSKAQKRRLLRSVMTEDQYKDARWILSRTSELKASWAAENAHQTSPQELPEPVRNFFFRTRLFQLTCRTYPKEILQKIDWEDVIDEAKSNIADYESWRGN